MHMCINNSHEQTIMSLQELDMWSRGTASGLYHFSLTLLYFSRFHSKILSVICTWALTTSVNLLPHKLFVRATNRQKLGREMELHFLMVVFLFHTPALPRQMVYFHPWVPFQTSPFSRYVFLCPAFTKT